MTRPLPTAVAVVAACVACFSIRAASAEPISPADIMRRFHDPRGGIIVVAHRGCHAAAPVRGWGTAAENSAAALSRCVAMGVDIMEVDIRRSRDGYLVVMHDAGVERTTNGTGKVSDLTLAELKALRLRDDEGGPDAAVTDQVVLTLDELLALAKGRIVLNLDIKDPVYPQVIDAVERARARDHVIVKTFAGIASPPLAAMAPYDRVPFMVIPTTGDPRAADLPAIVARQMAGRVKPIAFELPVLPEAALPAVTERTRSLGVPIWVNTLFQGFVTGVGGDAEARRDPKMVWGRLADRGVRIFQTDAVEALIRYRADRRLDRIRRPG